MHIGIIGGGFTGLSAGLKLEELGHKVTILEKETVVGGLAVGFENKDWSWQLEKHYHHVFTSDTSILDLAKRVDVQFDFSQPNTSWLINDAIYQVDSPIKLLTFSQLPIVDRLRMACILGFFKLMPYFTWLEQVTADVWLKKWMGKNAYNMFWEPLLRSKFGPYANDIALSWFWARIKARSAKLGYPRGGFQHLADAVAKKIVAKGGTVQCDVSVKKLCIEANQPQIICENGEIHTFDRVLVSGSNYFFSQISPQLPASYHKQLLAFKGIGAVNMVLEMDAPFFSSDVYWLSICQPDFPFLAVVEHTNFIDKSHYNNKNLVYIGKYLSVNDPMFNLTKEELLERYDPYLRKLSPQYREHLKNSYIFKVPFAQPIVTSNYSNKIIPFKTPMNGVYLANMQQVYPWDRGTNYAVEMGEKVAKLLVK